MVLFPLVCRRGRCHNLSASLSATLCPPPGGSGGGGRARRRRSRACGAGRWPAGQRVEGQKLEVVACSHPRLRGRVGRENQFAARDSIVVRVCQCRPTNPPQPCTTIHTRHAQLHYACLVLTVHKCVNVVTADGKANHTPVTAFNIGELDARRPASEPCYPRWHCRRRPPTWPLPPPLPPPPPPQLLLLAPHPALLHGWRRRGRPPRQPRRACCNAGHAYR